MQTTEQTKFVTSTKNLFCTSYICAIFLELQQLQTISTFSHNRQYSTILDLKITECTKTAIDKPANYHRVSGCDKL